MSMTGHLIGYRILAPTGARGTEEQESRKQRLLQSEFVRAVPSAGRLRASDLVLLRHHTAEGCRLEYYLRQRVQFDLYLGEQSDLLPADIRSDVDFTTDVAAVQLELESIDIRLALATSPAMTFKELNENSQDAEDIRTLRSLYGRKSREICLPTSRGERVVVLPAMPGHLPTSLKVTIHARIVDLHADYGASLVDVDCTTGLQILDQDSSSLVLPENMKANRNVDLASEDTLAMVKALDSREPLALTVEIFFDWVTGAPTSLEITSVPVRNA